MDGYLLVLCSGQVVLLASALSFLMRVGPESPLLRLREMTTLLIPIARGIPPQHPNKPPSLSARPSCRCFCHARDASCTNCTIADRPCCTKGVSERFLRQLRLLRYVRRCDKRLDGRWHVIIIADISVAPPLSLIWSWLETTGFLTMLQSDVECFWT